MNVDGGIKPSRDIFFTQKFLEERLSCRRNIAASGFVEIKRVGFFELSEFFFSGDLDYAPVAKDLLPKERTPKQVADLLALFGEALDTQRDFTPVGLEAFARAFAETNGWSSKELFMLLRLAATAKKATPPLFETLAGLGRELVRRRIRLCADLVKKIPAPAAKPAAPGPTA